MGCELRLQIVKTSGTFLPIFLSVFISFLFLNREGCLIIILDQLPS